MSRSIHRVFKACSGPLVLISLLGCAASVPERKAGDDRIAEAKKTQEATDATQPLAEGGAANQASPAKPPATPAEAATAGLARDTPAAPPASEPAPGTRTPLAAADRASGEAAGGAKAKADHRAPPASPPLSKPARSGTGAGGGDVGKKRAEKREGAFSAADEEMGGVKDARDEGPAPSRPGPTASPGVKAGAADDNQQFNAFLKFLSENGERALPWNVSDRLIVSVRDQKGLPLPGARVELRDGQRALLERTTYADGRAMIFRSEDKAFLGSGKKIGVRYGGKEQLLSLSASTGHLLEVKFPIDRKGFQQVPLDIAFVLDTTGSMGDEIEKLRTTIGFIHFQITHLNPRPAVRFGMVLYRDRGDEYVTQLVPFTSDVEGFKRKLDEINAGGGGDTPEDVQEGLHQAMTQLDWRKEGVRLAFLVGDAPPHLDYQQPYTYVSAMREAAARGIKIATIGASGLDLQGETAWRQIAQYTMAPFVFLTYGETGDSAGGTPSSVSHHVGANWVAENLDAIIVRLVKVELAHYGSEGAGVAEDYFSATANPKVPADQILEDLFRQSIKQLVDYCVLRLEEKTPTVVLPVQFGDKQWQAVASGLETRLQVGLGRSREFQLIEQKNLSELLKLVVDQHGHKYDDSKMVELGKLVPARLAIVSELQPRNPKTVELLIKMVRLQTGEILSLSLLKMDEALVSPRP